jgi:hypothetical protein
MMVVVQLLECITTRAELRNQLARLSVDAMQASSVGSDGPVQLMPKPMSQRAGVLISLETGKRRVKLRARRRLMDGERHA